jgi:hypothetical protein
MVWRASINSSSCVRIAFAVMPAQAGIQMDNKASGSGSRPLRGLALGDGRVV